MGWVGIMPCGWRLEERPSTGSGLEVGGRRLWMWDVGSEISNLELRNWEPVRRVGVRRTIANLKELNPHSEF